MRRSRVFGRLASAIQSTYSRLQLGLNTSNTLLATQFFFNAAISSGGVSTASLGAFTTRRETAITVSPCPSSINAAARFKYVDNFLSAGRFFTLAIHPSDPIPPSCSTPSSRRTFPISAPQNPKLQCSLNADTLHNIVPPWRKNGRLHFISSSTSGHAWCIRARRCVNTDCANGADFAMYSSTLGFKTGLLTTAVYIVSSRKQDVVRESYRLARQLTYNSRNRLLPLRHPPAEHLLQLRAIEKRVHWPLRRRRILCS